MNFRFLQLKFPVSMYFFFLLRSTDTTAQLNNDSGTLRIMNESFVVCIGNFTNVSGTITNDGKLEVQGNFNNSGIYNSTAKEDSLLLTGSETVALNSGPATINNLQVNKTSGGIVTLTANTNIGAGFDLLAGSFSTDPVKSYELIAPVSATFSFATGTYITGNIRRTNWVNGNVVIFHQANMSVTTTGGTAPNNLLVGMVPDSTPTRSERAVKRHFYFSPTGGSNYMADITFPYSSAELNANTEANLVPWYHTSYNNWNEKITGNTNHTASHYVTSNGIKADIFANKEWKLAEFEYNSKSPDLFVYPIPAKNTMNIVLIAEKNNKATIKILEVSGKLCKVLQKEVLKGLNRLSLNITGLSPGQYILKVNEGDAVRSKVVLVN